MVVSLRRKGGYILSHFLYDGYPRVALYVRGGSVPHAVHRLVLDAFVGPRPQGLQCRHLDGDRLNCHLSNLRWGTARENATDRVAHGTSRRKIDDGQVSEVRRRSRDGERQSDIARSLGVSPSLVCRILNGERRAESLL